MAPPSAYVVAGGVSAPGSSAFGDQAGGCLVVVAERLRDDGAGAWRTSWWIAELLPRCGGTPIFRRWTWRLTGFIGCPGWRPGKSHCELLLLA